MKKLFTDQFLNSNESANLIRSLLVCLFIIIGTVVYPNNNMIQNLNTEIEQTPIVLSNYQIAGISMLAGSGLFLCTSVALIAVDFVYYFPELQRLVDIEAKTPDNYNSYLSVYNYFYGILSGAIVSTVFTIGMLVSGVALMVYKPPLKRFALEFSGGICNSATIVIFM